MAFFGEVSFPDSVEHFLAYNSVEFAYAVYFLACVAKESGHTEFLAVIIGICTAHSDKFVPRYSEFGRI